MFWRKDKKEQEQDILLEEIPHEEVQPINIFNGELRLVEEQLVWDALRECYDPEIPVNIVDLGLVYEVKIQDNFVYVKMTLTAPGCGMGPMIAADARRRVMQVPGVQDAKIEIVFTPVWNPGMMTEQAKLILNM
jgi:metal-sulfur cluster biosynthetic enzyme